jgi:spermidine synthase
MLTTNSDKAAVIGIATGISLSGLSSRQWNSIDAVEIVPEVAEMAGRYFTKDNNDILTKDFVKTIIEDGRHFIKNSSNKYDLIVSDLFIPWQEGSAALYSREHFRGVRNALTPDGIFMLWLPMYEITREEFHLILRTMGSEFPVVSIWQNGFSSRGPVVGLCASLKAISTKTIENNLADIKDTASTELLRRHNAALFSRCIGILNLSMISTGPVNTLDKPILGFWAAKANRELLTGRRYIEEIVQIHNSSVNKMNEAITLWTLEYESWRKAGVSMTLSVHELLSGNRESAYANFNDYKNRMPVSLHRP